MSNSSAELEKAAVCHPNDHITGMYNTERHKDWEYGQERCEREGVNADVCATTWGGRCQWGRPPEMAPLDAAMVARSQAAAQAAIDDCKANISSGLRANNHGFGCLIDSCKEHIVKRFMKCEPSSGRSVTPYDQIYEGTYR